MLHRKLAAASIIAVAAALLAQRHAVAAEPTGSGGSLPLLTPIQTITGASHSYLCGTDVSMKTRRSNGGAAMSDILPGSGSPCLFNGAQLQISNVDGSASITLSAGGGTTVNGGSTLTIGPGRDVWLAYDPANTAWRTLANTASALLGPLTGDVTAPAGSSATTIAGGAVTASKMAAGAVGASSVTATGAQSSATVADRATYKAVRLDFRSDFGAACDGATDDTTQYNNMLSQYSATLVPVTITFPGQCVVDWSNNTITGNLSFEGIAGGGLQIKSGSTGIGNFLKWTGAGYTLSFKNFTFDFNGFSAAGGVAGALNVFAASRLVFDHSQIINATAPTGPSSPQNGINLLSVYDVTSCDIGNSVFSFTASSNYLNQGVFGGEAGNEIAHCKIHHNHVVNTTMAFGGATYTDVADNEIQGGGFGGSVAFENIDTAFRHNSITNNNIHDTLSTIDSNNTYLSGIENWNYGTLIEGNTIKNTCGFGILVGGQDTVIGNQISDIGSCQGGVYRQSGIVVNNNSGLGITGNYSFISGNRVFDDGPGTTLYGYSDNTAIQGVKLGVNEFNGVDGATNILGTVAYLSGQIDNRIVNPCGKFDQRNNGGIVTATSGFVGDQWQIGQTHPTVSIQPAHTTANMNQCPTDYLFTVVSSTTPAAGDFQHFDQNIGLGDVQDLKFGTAQATDLIYAFCVRISVSPFVGGWYVENRNASYTYTGTYNYTSPATDRQCFSFHVPGDPNNSLGSVATNAALRVGIDLGSGANNLAASGAWTHQNAFGSTSGTPFESEPNGTTLEYSNARLLPAEADEGWIPKANSVEFANVQRFAWTTFAPGTTPADAIGINTGEEQFPASLAATGANTVRLKAPAPMFKTPTTFTGFNPVTGSSAACRDETANADGAAAATFTNANTLGVTASCEGNASTVAGNMLGLHVLVDGGL